MRRKLVGAAVSLVAIVLPVASATAAAAKKVVTTKRVTGPQAVASQFG
jgi:hypothetical protein